MSAEASGDFRVLSTLNADGSRRWLRPKLSTGRWLNRRRGVGYALIALFVVLPHLRIGGRPPILLDIGAREFTFWGTTLYPTDTLLLALLVVSIFLTVFFLTALFGRVWCGWACPQTVYMELVFRPVERFFDGRPGQRRKQGGWRGPAKIATFVLLSLFLAHTFLAYFVRTDELRQWVTQSPLEHPIPFLIVVAVTGLMLFDFGFFREQLCIVACPYGRFQSVMLDRDSLIVGYDRRRGEPRGKLRRKPGGDTALPVLGDCIDCKLCVTTCPTGIDIRDGLQLECVNCTQCIDACDSVMDKIGRPRGLIRYSSERSLEDGERRYFRPRIIVYPVIVLVLMSIFVGLLATRADAFVSILRGRGLPFTVMADGAVANPIRVKIQNRTEQPATYTLSIPDLPAARLLGATEPLVVEPGETLSKPMIISAPSDVFVDGARVVQIRVRDASAYDESIAYRLVGPTAPITPQTPPAEVDDEP